MSNSVSMLFKCLRDTRGFSKTSNGRMIDGYTVVSRSQYCVSLIVELQPEIECAAAHTHGVAWVVSLAAAILTLKSHLSYRIDSQSACCGWIRTKMMMLLDNFLSASPQASLEFKSRSVEFTQLQKYTNQPLNIFSFENELMVAAQTASASEWESACT